MELFAVNKSDKNKAEILVYGYIGGDEVCSSDFVRALRDLEKTYDKIDIRINSAGGSVFEGFAIFNALLNCKAETIGYIDGVAASMGTVIALGCDKIYMSKIARFMTHSASGFAAGDANEMRANAELLDAIDNTIAAIYAKKTGKTVEACKKDYMMQGDKWFGAEQAVAEKLVDGIYDATPLKIPKTAKNEKELWTIYNEHRFAAIFNKNFNNPKMELQLSAASKAALNIGDNADVSAIDTAIASLVAKANKVDDLTTKLNDANQKLSDQEKAAKKEKVDAILGAALTAKKITAAAKTEFEAKFADDPDTLKKIIDALPAYTSIADTINNNNDKNQTELQALMAKSYDDLDREGKVERLRELSAESFQAKYKEKYGKEYGK